MPRSQGTSRKGKPKKGERAAGMGRALQKSSQKKFRPKMNGSSRGAGMAMAPGTENIGIVPEETKLGMKSILEMDDLGDFLTQAEMAGREFTSEREQYVTIDNTSTEYRGGGGGSTTLDSNAKQPRTQFESSNNSNSTAPQFVFRELSVPRRPQWDENTTAEELDATEKKTFLEWRRAIAVREEEVMEHHGASVASVTPFEKNIEVWRQLWRVLERSSCVVQIVDGRNPLFYLSQDLRRYATEELGKPMLLVINKSDYLSAAQRQAWHAYLDENGWDHLFFSAYDEQQKLDKAAAELRKADLLDEDYMAGKNKDGEDAASNKDDDKNQEESLPSEQQEGKSQRIRENVGVEVPLTREELIEWIHDFATRFNCELDERYDNRIQFGMVGFPNVGKSSVINVLVGSSKHAHGVVRVGVAAQPGKTKHFQTLYLPDNDDMMLCDCPGLVFPSFVSSTADLIAAGVYPISQMRDHWPVVELICRRIPREILNAHYGIQLPKPTVQDLKERGLAGHDGAAALPPPTAEELLGTYCIARSLLAASSGVPDYQRAARIVIKDYADGKLLFCHSPPNIKDLTTSARDPMDEMGFHKETLLTCLSRTDKLREKINPLLEQKQDGGDDDGGDALSIGDNNGDFKDNDNNEQSDVLDALDDLDIQDDLDLLDVVGGFAETTSAEHKAPAGKRGKAHKSIQKHGKKGRKGRNKDPYGCHSTPDEEILGAGSGGTGLVVKAGKYGKRGYTRPTSYAGARSATTTNPV
eukprot:CAMPEP_0195282226 /NCGR_PEP_ID=MMETSP0707-20130614/1195_1 /TAXON_ID=33640 /ORGANISM="Asterionellopsis glacialis, Strain CCMP134" /LENGTH=753 /DNA_ID=CAMNT_0040341179 /DNA_START=104 /DNA_END=2362 /DNA_ORIENTATION=-